MMVFCLALAGLATAGDEPKSSTGRELPPAEERAQQLTDKLKEQLGLTEEQVSKVAEINLRTAKQTDAIMNSPGEGRRGRLREVRAIQEQRDTELKKILTEEQWEKYGQIKDEMKVERRARAEEFRREQGGRGAWRRGSRNLH
jgi:NACalpha-BTF3-like transcription factor